MSTARRLLNGASWVYGSQLLTVVLQFGYAAVTSRAISPGGFGAYTIALAVTGLVSLLATGGLGQTVSRMVDLDSQRIKALVTYALLLGAFAGSVLFLSAPVWAWIWGVEASSEPIRWLAMSSSISPLLGLATGLMARTGRFRQLAIITVVSNVTGMTIGAVAVVTWHSASSLVVSAAVAQFLTLIGVMFATERQLFGVAPLRYGRSDIGFSGKLVFTNVLAYFTGNIVKFTMVRGIGAASLGHWNRAEVLTSIPLQQVQGAMIRAVYPEFRHDIDKSSRAKVVWTDMMILVAWVALTLSAIVLVIVPPLMPILFGAGWEVAEIVAGPLAIAGGLQIISTLLASAVEALGRFRWMVSTEIILIVLQVGAAIIVLFTQNIVLAVVALVFTNMVRHAWHVFLLGKHGYLNVPRLLKHYAIAASFSTCVALSLWVALQCLYLTHHSVIYWAIVLFCLLLPVSICLGMRSKLPAVVIARKYGLFRAS